MSEERKKIADIQLTGTQEEIAVTKAWLVRRGLDWVSTGKYYPRDDDPCADKFVHFLRAVTAPPDSPVSAYGTGEGFAPSLGLPSTYVHDGNL